jgi:hypothetical protein
MGYIREAFRDDRRAPEPPRNARGQHAPASKDGGYTAETAARLAAEAAALKAEREREKALKQLGLDLFGGEAFAPLQSGLFGDDAERVLRFVKNGETLGFAVRFAGGRLEAWSAVNGKPHERLEVA